MKRTSAFESVASGPVRGVFCGFDEAGEPLVDFPANETGGPVAAISTVRLSGADRDREVVLLFEDGYAARPIIVGIRQAPVLSTEVQPLLTIHVDGERLIYAAQKEIVLQCGKASITLTNAGKIVIRGEYIMSRSAGVNRIKGGSVQIN